MSLHLNTLSWLRANLLLLLNTAEETANTHVIVSGLARLGLKLTIYHTHVIVSGLARLGLKLAIYHTHVIVFGLARLGLQLAIYHTHGEHTNRYTTLWFDPTGTWTHNLTTLEANTLTITCLIWSLVPPDFKECCIRYSWFNQKYHL